MKRTKIVSLAMVALLASGAAVPTAVLANGLPAATEEKEEIQPVFIQITGVIDDVEVRDNATYYSIKDGDKPAFLVVTEETLVFDDTGKKVELKKGDQVTAYTYSDKPMLAIYPPQYSPEVVIVETEGPSSAVVGSFDKDLLDTDLSLQLNVSEKTELSSVSGKKVTAADLKEHNLLVFYTITTMSIPAQTPPEKVIVLDQQKPDQEAPEDSVIDKIIATDYHEVEGTKMVPLRLIAEELGYQVNSTGTGAILTKGPVSFTITRGEKAYGYNKALRYFKVAPALLEPSKTYVPVEFIQELME